METPDLTAFLFMNQCPPRSYRRTVKCAGVAWEVEVELLNKVCLMRNPRWRLNAADSADNNDQCTGGLN